MEPGGNSDPNMAAIRVSGPDVLATLTQACSQDATILKPAEQRLHSWETQPGFYTILQVAEIRQRHRDDQNSAVNCDNVEG